MTLIIKETALHERRLEAENALKEGKIAVYPTETCYGIGCLISARASVGRIYALKKRPKDQPLSVIAANTEMMGEYAVMTGDAEKLAEKFLPGPITLLLQRTRKVPEWFPGDKIGIRVPSSGTAKTLCEIAGEPIVSTSANISGERNLYAFQDVRRTFERKVGLIIDGGDLDWNKPSTIYNVEHKRVTRKGPVSLDEILKVVGGGNGQQAGWEKTDLSRD